MQRKMSCNKLNQFGLPLLDKGTAIPLLPGLPPPFREVPIRLTEDCLLQPPYPVLQDSLNVHIYSNLRALTTTRQAIPLRRDLIMVHCVNRDSQQRARHPMCVVSLDSRGDGSSKDMLTGCLITSRSLERKITNFWHRHTDQVWIWQGKTRCGLG